MLRIHFTSDDIARTRLAATPDPMWEAALSAHVLNLRGAQGVLRPWKVGVLDRLLPGTRAREQAALLFAINPPRGYFPDLLTPDESRHGLEAGIEAVLSLPKQRLKAEIGKLAQSRPMSPRVADLAEGRVEALKELGTAFRTYYETAIAPIAPRIQIAFEADRTVRAQQFLGGGMEAVLNGLHRNAHFADGVLTLSDFPREEDVYLHGRGLRLVPSFFKETDTKLMLLADAQLPQVLVYPVDRDAALVAAASREPLAALLGRTRAAVLELAISGGSTSEVARRLDISPAAASQHLSVLREAGLILSTRHANTVRHRVTPLGRAVLSGT